MLLRVDRVESDGESTLGKLHVDGQFECWTLEDQFRAGPKVKGETRIPAGRYQLKLREEGGFHAKYLEKYGAEWHRGVLHVTNVPNFEFILIHIGNSHDDTEGCLLVGQGQSKVDGYHYVTASRPAYEALYCKVRDRLLAGEQVEIEYVDLDPASVVAPEPVPVVVVVTGGAGPAVTQAPAAASTSEAEADKSRGGVVAGATAVAGAAVAGVGGVLLAEEAPADSGATPVTEAASDGGIVAAVTDPDNTLKLVLIGLGVIVVLCALYFIVKRWGEWRRSKPS